MPQPELSVIIGSLNQRDKLQLVLASLTKQTLPPNQFEVVICDSGSSDHTQEAIRPFTEKLDLAFFEKTNTGKASARNVAAFKSRGTFLFFTDADMIAHPKLLEIHREALQESQQHGTPTIYEGATYNISQFTWDTPPAEQDPYIKRRLKPNQKLGWYYFLTGNLSLPKQTFLAAGGFDEAFQEYGWEDLELGYRLTHQQIPIRFLPNAKNYHFHPLSPEDELQRKYRMGQSATLFFQKHPHRQLKWFLGMNPLSMWLHERVPPRGKIIRWLKKRTQTNPTSPLQKVGHYLLQEHAYLSGVKSRQPITGKDEKAQ